MHSLSDIGMLKTTKFAKSLQAVDLILLQIQFNQEAIDFYSLQVSQ